MDINKKQFIKKADIIFFLALLAAALLCFIILRLYSTPGSYAVVSYDGTNELIQIPLEQSVPRYFLITYTEQQNVELDELSKEEWNIALGTDMEFEYNAFWVENHEISMIQSSCPDKICVNHRAVSRTGENIICLPHKLIIEIAGGKDSGLDGAAY